MPNRKNALFAGHDEGAENWACLASLIETALCRARHKQVYAELRTMPNGSGRTRRSDAFASRRRAFVPGPFGIVLLSIAHPGRRAGGHSLESGLAFQARTV
jgi:transposase